MTRPSMYVDGHLDLAYNVQIHDRDLTRGVLAQRRKEKRKQRELMVTLPELRRGGVGVVFATLFTLPLDMERPPGAPPLTSAQKSVCYETPDEAHELAREQLEIYETWEEERRIRILRTKKDLENHVADWTANAQPNRKRPVGVVLLMEGADPIRTPDELSWWTDRGVRIVGPAWQRTRYSGGTHAPGPLTDLGHDLVDALVEQRVPIDTSHLAEESFWDVMEHDPDLVLASHSNARAITPGDRHLTDDMIREIGRRDGVVGIVLGDDFLRPASLESDVPASGADTKPSGTKPSQQDSTATNSPAKTSPAKSSPEQESPDETSPAEDDPEAHTESTKPPEPVDLDDVKRHAEHVASLIGWDRVAIGSDFDGGFGVQETPVELTRGADFHKLGTVPPPEYRDDVLGQTWLRFLRRTLPPA